MGGAGHGRGVVGHTESEKPFGCGLLHIFLKGAEGVAAGRGVGVHIKIDLHFRFLVYALNVREMWSPGLYSVWQLVYTVRISSRY